MLILIFLEKKKEINDVNQEEENQSFICMIRCNRESAKEIIDPLFEQTFSFNEKKKKTKFAFFIRQPSVRKKQPINIFID